MGIWCLQLRVVDAWQVHRWDIHFTRFRKTGWQRQRLLRLRLSLRIGRSLGVVRTLDRSIELGLRLGDFGVTIFIAILGCRSTGFTSRLSFGSHLTEGSLNTRGGIIDQILTHALSRVVFAKLLLLGLVN